MSELGELLIKDEKLHPLEGVVEWVNSINGFTCLDISFKADPEKRSPEWELVSKQGMPKAEWEREYGSSWIVYDGKPVYQDYNSDLHETKGNIIASRKQKLISGYDLGPNDVHMAWVLGLVHSGVPAVTWIDEYLSEDGDTDSFMEVVVSKLRMEWELLGGFNVHVADQSAWTKTKVDKFQTAAIDTMRVYGVYPIRGEISYSKRRQSVEQLLVKPITWISEKPIPRWRAHERCVLLREAMQGGYHYPKNISGLGDAYKPLPVKNKFSHIANAMEYAASKIESLDYVIPFEGRKLPRMTRI